MADLRYRLSTLWKRYGRPDLASSGTSVFGGNFGGNF